MPDHSMNADLHVAEMIHDLLDDDRFVMMKKTPDGLYEGDAGPGRRCIAMTLEDCIEGLTAHARTKVCIRDGCLARGKPQSISSFGPDSDAKDGHASVCRACENARVNAHNKKKKSAAIAPTGHQGQVGEGLGKVQ